MFLLSRDATDKNSFICLVKWKMDGKVRKPDIPDFVPFETLEHSDQRNDGMVKIRVWVFPEQPNT